MARLKRLANVVATLFYVAAAGGSPALAEARGQEAIWFEGRLLTPFPPIDARPVFTHGRWIVLAHETGAARSACSAGQTGRDGVALIVSMLPNRVLGLAVRDPSANGLADRLGEAIYEIDGERQAVKVLARGKALPVLELGPNPGRLRALQRGRRLRIILAESTYSFSLEGSHRALAAVLDCIARHNPEPVAPPADILVAQ